MAMKQHKKEKITMDPSKALLLLNPEVKSIIDKVNAESVRETADKVPAIIYVRPLGDKLLFVFYARARRKTVLDGLSGNLSNEVSMTQTNQYPSGIVLKKMSRSKSIAKPKLSLMKPLDDHVKSKDFPENPLTRVDAQAIFNSLKSLDSIPTAETLAIRGDNYNVFLFETKTDRERAIAALNRISFSSATVSYNKFEDSPIPGSSSTILSKPYMYILAEKKEKQATPAEVQKSTETANKQVAEVLDSTETVTGAMDSAMEKMKKGQKLSESELSRISKLHSKLAGYLEGKEIVSKWSLKTPIYALKGRATKLRALIAETRLKLSKFETTAAKSGQVKAQKEAAKWKRDFEIVANDYLPRLKVVEEKQKRDEEAKKRRKIQKKEEKPVQLQPTKIIILEEAVVPGLVKLKREKVQRIISKFLKEKKAWRGAATVNNQKTTPLKEVSYTLRRSESVDLKRLLLSISKKDAKQDTSRIIFTIDRLDFIKYLTAKKKPPKEFKNYSKDFIVSMEITLWRNKKDDQDRLKFKRVD